MSLYIPSYYLTKMTENKKQQVGPYQIEYVHKANSAGEPLVFLHGFGTPPKH